MTSRVFFSYYHSHHYLSLQFLLCFAKVSTTSLIYTLSLHDALPISSVLSRSRPAMTRSSELSDEKNDTILSHAVPSADLMLIFVYPKEAFSRGFLEITVMDSSCMPSIFNCSILPRSSSSL